MNDITQLSTLYSNAIARAEKAEEALRIARERYAIIARCHADDRPRRDSFEWNDGYMDGCKGAHDAIMASSTIIEVPAEDEDCDYCADHVPAHGYWRCPQCDAEWPDGDVFPPPPVRETP